MILVGLARHAASTTIHRFWVARHLAAYIVDDLIAPFDEWRWALYLDLMIRATFHDLSKYAPDEALAFARTSHKLKETTYGSDEYRALLREIKPAIEAHYARNSHHPEHHRKGIDGMSEADVIEMVADWGAAVRRHHDGNLDESITMNAKRFNYDHRFEDRLRETAARMGLLH